MYKMLRSEIQRSNCRPTYSVADQHLQNGALERQVTTSRRNGRTALIVVLLLGWGVYGLLPVIAVGVRKMWR